MNHSLSSCFHRPTRAQIDLNALVHNVRVLRARNGGRIFPVLKANAYGHGAVACAQRLAADLEPGEMFCVASVEEAVQLRRSDITAPLLILSALLPADAAACVEYNLTATVCSLPMAKALSEAAQRQNATASAHFKIDTGMGRLGVYPEDVATFWQQIRALPNLQITGIFTHFACADESEDNQSRQQCALFEKALQNCGQCLNLPIQERAIVHAANSAATWRYGFAAYDAVRPGISIYGVSPFEAKVLSQQLRNELDAVMTFETQITLIKNHPKNAGVSYGGTWKPAQPSRLAVLPVGYADGYHRLLSNRAKVLLRGQLCPVVGRITMDQTMIDVSDIWPPAQTEETVTLWGPQLPVEEVAKEAQTIGYELLTAVAPRVPRLYD